MSRLEVLALGERFLSFESRLPEGERALFRRRVENACFSRAGVSCFFDGSAQALDPGTFGKRGFNSVQVAVCAERAARFTLMQAWRQLGLPLLVLPVGYVWPSYVSEADGFICGCCASFRWIGSRVVVDGVPMCLSCRTGIAGRRGGGYRPRGAGRPVSPSGELVEPDRPARRDDSFGVLLSGLGDRFKPR